MIIVNDVPGWSLQCFVHYTDVYYIILSFDVKNDTQILLMALPNFLKSGCDKKAKFHNCMIGFIN